MANLDVFGETGPTRVSRKYKRRDENNVTYIEVWEGPVGSLLGLFDASSSSSSWDDVDLDSTKGKDTLTLTRTIASPEESGGSGIDGNTPDSTAEDLLERWELLGQDLLVDLRSHPDFADDLTEVVLAEEAIRQGNGAFTSATQAVQDYYDLRKKGVAQYLRSAAILQRTITTREPGGIVIGWSGVDRAGSLPLGVPPLIVSSIGALPDGGGTSQWLRRAPQVSVTVGGGRRLVDQWMFAREWSAVLYGGSGTP